MTTIAPRRALLATAAVSALLIAPAAAQHFERVATYPVFNNLPEGVDPATETVAEIVAASEDGMILAYTDGAGDAIGYVDLADPSAPEGLGRTVLDGEPTAVSIKGDHVYAGVNTAESFIEPTGHLAVIALTSQEIVATCDVGGQPDSVAVSPDGRFVAVVVENERDEDLDDGVIPQLPPGTLAIFDRNEDGTVANCDAARFVDLTGLAEVAPSDPEPEFVDINDLNHAVVSLQENNHLAVVDLATGAVAAHFSAGTVTLDRIDTVEDDIVAGTGTLEDLPREPDAVGWLDDTRFVTADEGDYEGGSRGFTIFNTDGEVLYEAGTLMEYLGMAAGHYPEHRAENKGVEPEGVEVAEFDGEPLFFVNSERGNFVTVFRDDDGAPTLLDVLPTAVAPEGLLAIADRGLFVVATEEDSEEDGIRATLTVYARTAETAQYPDILSATDAATQAPIGWGALSGLAADPDDADTVYAVNDSAYAASRIYTMDIAEMPARITAYVNLSLDGELMGYDLEGIANAADGGFWLVSEGHPENGRPNVLIKAGVDGTVTEEILLPEEVAAEAVRFGFEGVATFERDGAEHVVVAVQRAWGDDPEGHAKLAVYTPSTGDWSFLRYPLEAPSSPRGGWVGLSEIVHLGDERFALIERDNQPGTYSTYKAVTTIDLAGIEPAPFGGDIPVVEKTIAIDLLPPMRADNGWIGDKPEGLTVTADGQVIAVTDNDGVDDAHGETQLMMLGTASEVLN